MTQSKTQCERILKALQRGPLTAAQAAHRFDIYSGFHRRLTDLRRRGHTITDKDVVVKNSQGKTVRFKRYYLVT